MYAIIEDSGQQFRVSPQDIIRVDTRELAEGATQLTFDRVLLIGDEENSANGRIGTPLVEGAKVVADIQDAQYKGEKVDIQKFKRRKGYRRKKGHRQKYIEVKIARIEA
jgi:large subunit ribosomal protein L21